MDYDIGIVKKRRIISPDDCYFAVPVIAAGGNTTTAEIITLLGSAIVGIWDADLGVAVTGANVTSWTDQSSNSYVLGLNAAGGTVAPTSPQFSSSSYNSKAGISFTAASRQYLATTSAAITLNSNVSSWFVAVQMAASSQDYCRVLSFLASTETRDYFDTNSMGALIRDSSTQAFNWVQGNVFGTSSVAIIYDTPTRMGTVIDGTNVIVYKNNTLGSTALRNVTLGVGGGSQLAVGQASNPLGDGDALLTGVIRRILVTNTAVSSGDRSSIDSWLQG